MSLSLLTSSSLVLGGKPLFRHRFKAEATPRIYARSCPPGIPGLGDRPTRRGAVRCPFDRRQEDCDESPAPAAA